MRLADRTSLLNRGLAMAQGLYPAVITVGGQTFAVSRSTIVQEKDLMHGGPLPKWRVSFWITLAALAAKSVAAPQARAAVAHTGGRNYVLASVGTEPGGSTLILRCESPDA